MDIQGIGGITMCFVKAAVVAGTTSTITNTGTIIFSIRGKALSKAAMTNAATPTVDAATNKAFLPVLPNNGCAFIVGLDSNGNMKCVQGTIVPLDAGGAFVNASTFGSPPNDFCPIAYLITKSASNGPAGGWIFGTSNLSAVTGVTQTFVDITSIPDRPQVQ